MPVSPLTQGLKLDNDTPMLVLGIETTCDETAAAVVERGGDAGKLREADSGLLHCALDNAVERLDMGARRDLRHHAAEGRVLLGLRADDVRQNASRSVALALDHGGRGFIAGGLDPQHQHRRVVIQFGPLREPLKQRFRNPVALRGLNVQSLAGA